MDLCNYNEIRKLLERYHFNFTKSMGQNFLTAPWVPERIAMESGISPGSGVLEIGPGIGCLTVHLAEKAKKVVAVELDKRLIPVLGETLANMENVVVLSGDIMKLDIKSLVAEHFPNMTDVLVCANLPYNITTPVLAKLIEAKAFDRLTVMIQREVASRICSKPGTRDYGAFTVFTNFHTEPKKLFDVSPDCFVPRPKVVSSVITMETRKSPVCHIEDERHFFKVVRAAFGQRRKTLVNCLSGVFKLPKSELESILSGFGLDTRIRGEALGIEEFARISAAIIAAESMSGSDTVIT